MGGPRPRRTFVPVPMFGGGWRTRGGMAPMGGGGCVGCGGWFAGLLVVVLLLSLLSSFSFCDAGFGGGYGSGYGQEISQSSSTV